MVSKMVRQRKKFVCSSCGAESLKFAGYCPGCNKAGTMQEKQILPPKEKSRATSVQKARRRKWVSSEREVAREMTTEDGPDPIYKNVASSTGRVGHITGMQIDSISRSYVIENKNRNLPVWLTKAWVQILQRAVDFNKAALLHIDPPNLPKEFIVNGVKKKTSTIAMISQARHVDLIRSEKALDQVRQVIDSPVTNIKKVQAIKELLGL